MKLFQGDIVLVEFPFSDRSGSKYRPAIIISNSKINRTSDVVLAAITSQSRVDDYSFVLENKFLVQPLHKDNCEVKCNNIFTADRSIVVKKISSLKSEKYPELFDKILLGLSVESTVR